jgi:hypothetical protein
MDTDRMGIRSFYARASWSIHGSGKSEERLLALFPDYPNSSEAKLITVFIVERALCRG